jgi:non-ribosomal peptide synthetase component F
VRATCIAAYAHQDLPFEYLESELERSSKHGEELDYRVMLNYRNQPEPARQSGGIAFSRWDGKNRAGAPGIAISRLDLSFELREASSKLTGAVNFKTDLFSDDTITEMLEDYQKIVRQLIANPERKISRLATTAKD